MTNPGGTLLNGTLTLHGVNIEELATRVANEWCRRNRAQGSHLSPDRQEDLTAYLVAEAWRISINYDPARAPRFRSYAYSLLYFRCTDWLRKDEGRTIWKFSGTTHHRQRPQLIPLDDSLRNHVGATDADTPSDHGPDSGPALPGLEDHGDRTATRDLNLIRAAANRRAA